MRFLSSLCCCIKDPSDDERPETTNTKNGTGALSPTKSSQELPLQTLPILNNAFTGSIQQNNETALSPAKSPQELSSQTLPVLDNASPGPSQQNNETALSPTKSPQELPPQTLLISDNPSSGPSQQNNETAVAVHSAAELGPSHHAVTDRQTLWEYWNLNEQSLQEIREWNQKHPEKKLTRIFKAISDKLDPDSALLELFPDNLNGVPIRGLIKCLIHLCKLPAAAALAKDDAISFMLEIVMWLEELADAFDSGSRGQLESKAWKSLEDMGKLINNACRWASELLRSGILTSQQFSVQTQIQEYWDEFTRTAERFGIITGLLLAQGLDNVAQDARTIAEKENIAKRLKFLEGKLLLRLITNASYNHQEKRPCEPETRVEVLKEIRSWLEDVSEKSQCFYWLSGQPGVGKSAITASIARDCLDRHILGTQFFISRNDARTTDPRVLFPTICWELCQRFPQVAEVMERTLQDKPTLIDDISDDQAAELFVKAIEEAAAIDPLKAVAVVIDALDETDKNLRRLAEILSKVVANLPRNAKVFISSRTENAITQPFHALRDHERVKTRHLTAQDSVEEVPQFMKKKVKEILKESSIDWARWGDDRMERFSSKASGLYIWAETALKYLRAEIENSGVTCFKWVLDITENCMDSINDLYLKILEKTCKPRRWEYQRFRRIVGVILVRQVSLPITAIGQLLDLKDPNSSEAVDLVHFVRQYRTVLVDDTKEIDVSVVPRMHKSFADFITSEQAGEFRVDVRESHGELALQCINQLDNAYVYAYLNEGEQGRPVFPSQLVYASQHWQSHLTRMIEPDMDKDAGEKKEYEKHDTQDLPAEPRGMKDWKPDREEIERERGVGMFFLAFSPDGAQFGLARRHAIHIWDSRTGTVTMSLVGHESYVNSVGFSPDGTQLVSASNDDTARIWDTQTGRELHVLRGHTSWVGHAKFSHDGKTVVTSSRDKTVRTWDSTTGQQLNVFEGHMNWVVYCTFSPNDQRIASLSDDDLIMVWDVNSGKLISEFKHDDCRMISFCPCGGHLISHDQDGEIKLWDVESGNQQEHAQFLHARLAFVDDSDSHSKQESTTTYIHIPLRLKPGSSIPQVYSLKTKYGDVCGVVEHDHPEGVWDLVETKREVNENENAYLSLFVATGATVMGGSFVRDACLFPNFLSDSVDLEDRNV